MGVSSFFNVGGTLFWEGGGGPPREIFLNSRFNFPHSGAFYTKNTLFLCSSLELAWSAITDYYYVLV